MRKSGALQSLQVSPSGSRLSGRHSSLGMKPRSVSTPPLTPLQSAEKENGFTVFKDDIFEEQPSKTKLSLSTVSVSEQATVSTATIGMNTDIDGDEISKCENSREQVLKMLTTYEPPSAYWKMLAAERQAALKEALQENEELVNELDRLKQENERLEELAVEGQKYAQMLMAALGTEDDDQGVQDHDDA